MDNFALFESFSGLDDHLLERSEKKRKPRVVWTRWAVAAACFVVIAAGAVAVPGLVRGHGADVGPDVGATAPGSGVGPTAAVPGEEVSPTEVPGLVLNEAAEDAVSGGYAWFSTQAQELTDGQRAETLPEMIPDWVGRLDAAAEFYRDGEFIDVRLYFEDLRLSEPLWTAWVTVTLSRAGAQTGGGDIEITPEEPVKGHIGELEYTAYRYQSEYGGVLLWANFRIGDVVYHISANAYQEVEEQFARDIYDLLSCYQSRVEKGVAPDLDDYHMKETVVWIANSDLTLAQAREDEDFGAYFPKSPPQGFTIERIQRYKAEDGDWLYGLWDDGTSRYTRWEASWLEEDAASRVTGVEDRENYDLSLYPAPWGKEWYATVPEEMWYILDEPVFRAEELTLDTIYARAYKEDNEWHMNFAVLYGDVMLRVYGQGVSPEWVFEQLTKAEQ